MTLYIFRALAQVWAFGEEIASLSLLAGSVMRFKPVFTVGVDPETAVDVEFPARALLLMTGDARYKWSHAIQARKHDKVDGQIVRKMDGPRFVPFSQHPGDHDPQA